MTGTNASQPQSAPTGASGESAAHMRGMSDKKQISTVQDLMDATGRGTLSPAEVASVIGVDNRTVYRAIEDEQIPSFELGRLKRIPRVHVVKMLGLDAA